MAEPIVTADGNAAPEGSSEVDSQLAEMHTAEGDAAQEPAEPASAEPAAVQAAPEVKKVVPLAALHEERNARKELQRQMQELQAGQAQRDAIINQRLAALVPKELPPDPATDQLGYLAHSQSQAVQQAVQQAVEPFLKAQQEQAQRQQQEAYVANLRMAVANSAESFKKTAPDIAEAGSFVIQQRARELMVLGEPEHAATAQATQELDNLLMQWAHNRMNPAETAYEFAKARGYTPKAAQTPQQTPAEKIAAQQKGAAAARSLGGGGAPNAGRLTAEALANMSEEDFSKLTPGQWQQAMGG